MEKKSDLASVGELNVDMIVRGFDTLPSLGEEKIASEFEIVLGGSAAIFACGAATLGLDVKFIGKVGDDDYEKYIPNYFKEHNIEIDSIIVDPRIKTGITIPLTITSILSTVCFWQLLAANIYSFADTARRNQAE